MNECPATDNGQHMIDWASVPAQYLNGRIMAPAHNRGICFACGEIFRKMEL